MVEVTYRLARLGDHDSILTISPDALGGMDYLTHKLRSLLLDQDYNCFLGERKGQTIAFLAGRLQLGGCKVTLKAGRVRESCRGQGIYKNLLNVLLSNMKEKYPGIKTEEFSTADNNPSLSKVYESNQYTAFMKRHVGSFHLKKTVAEDCQRNVRELCIGDFTKLVNQNEICARIFPTRIYVIWEMYDPEVSEIKYVEKLNPTILVTLNNADAATDPGEATALSLMSSYSIVGGQLYVIQIHLPRNTSSSTSTELVEKLIHANISKIEIISERDLLFISVDERFHGAVNEAAKYLELPRTDKQYCKYFVGFNRRV